MTASVNYTPWRKAIQQLLNYNKRTGVYAAGEKFTEDFIGCHWFVLIKISFQLIIISCML